MQLPKVNKKPVKRQIVLSEDANEVSLANYFGNREYSDVNLIAIKGSPIACHKVVLCKLPFFHAILHSPMTSDYNKTTNTYSIKMSNVVLNVVLGYLYEVPQPFAGLGLNGSTIIDLFDELVPIGYTAILQDIYDCICSHIDWKTIEVDRMVELYTKAALHKLNVSIYPKFSYNGIAKIDFMTAKHMLKQEIILASGVLDNKKSEARLVFAGIWCITHTNDHEKKQLLGMITEVSGIPRFAFQNIHERLLKFGWCDVWNKFITGLCHGFVKNNNTDNLVFSFNPERRRMPGINAYANMRYDETPAVYKQGHQEAEGEIYNINNQDVAFVRNPLAVPDRNIDEYFTQDQPDLHSEHEESEY
jgi:hypothetical protein